jgi:hypothetical protein
MAIVRLILLFALLTHQATVVLAQLPSDPDLERDVTRARISEQRVQRQTEVMRLETMLERLDSRLTRIERTLLSGSRLPLFTIAESEASLKLAEAQLSSYEQAPNDQQDHVLQLAKHRLAVVQAQGQLQMARAAHTERLLLLELEVLYAERKLTTAGQELHQLERLIARGYASSESLKAKQTDKAIAEKEVQLAKLRLDTEKNSNPPVGD